MPYVTDPTTGQQRRARDPQGNIIPYAGEQVGGMNRDPMLGGGPGATANAFGTGLGGGGQPPRRPPSGPQVQRPMGRPGGRPGGGGGRVQRRRPGGPPGGGRPPGGPGDVRQSQPAQVGQPLPLIDFGNAAASNAVAMPGSQRGAVNPMSALNIPMGPRRRV